MRFDFDMKQQHFIWLRKSPEHLNIHLDLIYINMHLMRCNIYWTMYSINNVGEVFHDLYIYFLKIWTFCYLCIHMLLMLHFIERFMEFNFKWIFLPVFWSKQLLCICLCIWRKWVIVIFFGLFQMHVHGCRFRMYLACLTTHFEIAKRSYIAKKFLIKSIQECSIQFVSFVVQFWLQECICSCFVMIIRKCLFCFFLCWWFY